MNVYADGSGEIRAEYSDAALFQAVECLFVRMSVEVILSVTLIRFCIISIKSLYVKSLAIQGFDGYSIYFFIELKKQF